MELLLKSAAGALIAAVLGLIIGKHNKENAVMISIVACCMIAASIVRYLEPTIDFVNQLQSIGSLDSGILEILLKSTGIAILSEIVVLICNDAGNTALGKTLQLLATVVILWLALPLLNTLINLIENTLMSV